MYIDNVHCGEYKKHFKVRNNVYFTATLFFVLNISQHRNRIELVSIGDNRVKIK